MEKFVVSHFGHDDIELWANFNATIHMVVEIPRLPGPLGPLERLRQQLELYQSEMKFLQIDQNKATLNIIRCGIWKYRELARSKGVVITLKSPCEYCTIATNANITAKGYKADFELIDANGVRGCSWTIHNSL
ncbi:hypothetical protein [Xenorhabdus sp. SGI240]|uniref:hypothetical protein n=1 Tax=Xenorhabdus sp. SGI240 TaxID=3158262 RepID=UPI0032B72231